MIRVVAVDLVLVFSSTNAVSIHDGGSLVHANLVGERFPERVLATTVLHTIPGKQAGLDGIHPLRVQFVLSKALGNLAVKGDPFVWAQVTLACVSHHGVEAHTFVAELIPQLLLLWSL